MNLRSRLIALEHRRLPSEPQIITVRGGLCEFNDTLARIGHETLHRELAEPFETFQARALDVAKRSGEQFTIIGGLPD